MTTEPDVEFENMLDYLRRARGFDFTAYKRTSLKRRVDKRMEIAGIQGYDAYVDHLQVHPEEFSALFNTILINVTSFFRDTPVWDFVRTDVVPALLSSKDRRDAIRVWSAGCASGEEAYTLAILFAEALGADQFRERVKIYATDVDEEALAQARQAVYTERQVEAVPPALLKKYFDRNGSQYGFHKDLRRTIIFGRHDLVQDAPISRADLIACRNTLMYFNAEVQSKMMARFFFGLNEGGHMVLGRAEMLFNQANMFAPVDLKRRIFRALTKVNQRERLLLLAQGRDEPLPAPTVPNHVRLRDAAFDTDAMAQVVIDRDGIVIGANDQSRRQFGLSIRDVNRPLQDLEISYKPIELRGAIQQAVVERRTVAMKDIRWDASPGEVRWFDVVVTPLIDEAGAMLGTKVSFPDVTRYRTLQEELQHSKQELATAYEELQSTNEELETTNEELQSTVEELETTNEELQSTNEELETMNEELQSTNEELQTMNEELRTRSTELNEVNGFLQSILGSIRAGVIVVDRNMQVLVWNSEAEDLWGLRADEVRGAHLLNLDIGLPLDDVKATIRATLAGAKEPGSVVVKATNRRGREFPCRVTCTALADSGGSPHGVILMMEDERDREGDARLPS